MDSGYAEAAERFQCEHRLLDNDSTLDILEQILDGEKADRLALREDFKDFIRNEVQQGMRLRKLIMCTMVDSFE